MTEAAPRLDATMIAGDLDRDGFAILPRLIDEAGCDALARGFEQDALYRNRVVMARHGYGQGEYRYFAYPLPAIVADLRARLYPVLAPIANRWNAALDNPARFPTAHDDYLAECQAAGQVLPTPLLLRYGAGDYNRLHQDVYGPLVFPFQAVFLLSRPGIDFTGGEFVLTEQRPRMQSRAEVVAMEQGGGVIFPVRDRPVTAKSGFTRVIMRHGVSRVRSGLRHTLGIIFHDAA